MIIDCHGHYTTAPPALQKYRDAQLEGAHPRAPRIGDEAIRTSIEAQQLRLQRERDGDLTLFSPRASAMGHHLGSEEISIAWSQVCNDLIARVVDLYPDNFVGVCQLPQHPRAPLNASVAELRRCVH
ncbi:MAG: amidohydrolase family protein, partial [Steroidobacteraceae bacterium]